MKNKEKQPKIVRISYKMMRDFLLTLGDETVINIGSLSKCLACQTVQHFFGISVSSARDYKNRQQFSYFSSFKLVTSQVGCFAATTFVVPDKFAIWCDKIREPNQTAYQLKKVLEKLTKKKLV